VSRMIRGIYTRWPCSGSTGGVGRSGGCVSAAVTSVGFAREVEEVSEVSPESGPAVRHGRLNASDKPHLLGRAPIATSWASAPARPEWVVRGLFTAWCQLISLSSSDPTHRAETSDSVPAVRGGAMSVSGSRSRAEHLVSVCEMCCFLRSLVWRAVIEGDQSRNERSIYVVQRCSESPLTMTQQLCSASWIVMPAPILS